MSTGIGAARIPGPDALVGARTLTAAAVVFAISLHAALPLRAIGIDSQVAASHVVLPFFVVVAGWWLATGRGMPLAIGWGWVAGAASLTAGR